MLKIKSLSAKPINDKLVKLIYDNNLSERRVAKCLGISASWLSTLLSSRKLTVKDKNTIEKVIKALSKKRGNK